ncbi:MAG TPA: signal peptidase I [Ornithinicoccus sp.]|nr:signal peptidase I [Ornithinicoccus sp.]
MTRKIISAALLALLVLGWALSLRPVALGGPATYVVVTGQSMEPTYHDGDLVVLRAQDAYAVDDVVTFAVPEGIPGAGALIIHRIIGGTEEAFAVQGDNNPRPDEWTPSEGEILGAQWFSVPSGGKLLREAMNPAALAAAAGGFITMLVLLKPAPSRPREMADSHTDDSDDSDDCETDSTPQELQHA